MLCDVENFLGLAYIILLLECVQNLSKFGHTQDVLICDFVNVVKVCEVDIYQMYYDLVIQYSSKDFVTFISIVDHYNETLHTT
jgi:hypothetical protein